MAQHFELYPGPGTLVLAKHRRFDPGRTALEGPAICTGCGASYFSIAAADRRRLRGFAPCCRHVAFLRARTLIPRRSRAPSLFRAGVAYALTRFDSYSATS